MRGVLCEKKGEENDEPAQSKNCFTLFAENHSLKKSLRIRQEGKKEKKGHP